MNITNIDLKIEQTDRTHRIQSFKKDGSKRKTRPTILKFVRYTDRRNVFINKKSLIKERMSKLKEAKEQYGFKQEWTIDYFK